MNVSAFSLALKDESNTSKNDFAKIFKHSESPFILYISLFLSILSSILKYPSSNLRNISKVFRIIIFINLASYPCYIIDGNFWRRESVYNTYFTHRRQQ